MGLATLTFQANLSKGHFYPKNKFQKVTEKNVVHTEMQGYYNKFKY